MTATDKPIDFTGREARCDYDNNATPDAKHTHKRIPSSPNPAFFAHQPDKAFDRYYCGCFGWD